MLRLIATAGGALLAMLGSSASAQDLGPGPASGSRASSNTGFRIEALAGYDNAGFDSVHRGDGLLYGIGVGYDLGAGRFRMGLEAEASDSTASTETPLIGFPGNVRLRASRDLYVGVRLGIQADPGLLFYAKAGYSNFEESNRFPPSVGSIVTHPYSDGYRIGAGAELAITARTFLKAEYRYSAYERAQDFDRHQAVIGFGFRF